MFCLHLHYCSKVWGQLLTSHANAPLMTCTDHAQKKSLIIIIKVW